jgi:NADP-dependent 3-hydroxy acid dehydrogenase YdfG
VILVNSWKRILLEDDIHIEKGIKPKHNIRVTCIESGAVSTELLETITDESME